jgi:aldehyde:ferredoxin oxidoreductase
MGSKNLKAIAVLGTESVGIADDESFRQQRKQMGRWMKESPVLYPFFAKYGTSRGIDGHGARGYFPARNFQDTGEFVPIETLGSEARQAQTIGHASCAECPVGCGQLMLARTGRHAGILTEGPEYETIYSFGGQTGVADLDSVIAADRLSDEFGLDTMSAGVSIGFAMELFERGLLSSEDVDGLDLSFGNHESMLTLLEKIAMREGFGDVLADGVRVAAARLGKDTEYYAMHVKGLELPAYDPRGAMAQGMNLATAFTGADHNRGYAIQEIFGVPVPFEADRFSTERKGELTKWNQDVRTAVCDCPTLCAFVFDTALAAHALEHTAAVMNAVTGIELTPEEVQRVGERINNLARVFNVRAGFSRADDTLPTRVLTEPLKAGASKGHVVGVDEFNAMLDEYYLARGWDLATGVPSREKLAELGLEEALE